MTKKDCSFHWGEEQDAAFIAIKQKLVERPIPAMYNRDANTEVHCDASKVELDSILLQRQGKGVLKPIQYFSGATTKAESNYHLYGLETIAVVAVLIKFRILLKKNTLLKKNFSPRIARWWQKLLH